MRIFVVGATGRTGRRVVAEAASRGHRVSALARHGSKQMVGNGCTVLVGEPTNQDMLARLIANHDVIISCLGQRNAKDGDLLRSAAEAMTGAMRRTNVTRYLVLSQGLLFPSANLLVRLLRWILRRHVRDSEAMETIVRASAPDWTIVRPPRLLDGGRPSGYRIARGARPEGAAAMQRADLASFLVDESERHEHGREIVGIASGDRHA